MGKRKKGLKSMFGEQNTQMVLNVDKKRKKVKRKKLDSAIGRG